MAIKQEIIFNNVNVELQLLTPPQKVLLIKIKEYYIEHGYMPSIEELRIIMNKNSLSTIHEMLVRIEAKGYIRRKYTEPRAIYLVLENLG